MLKLERTSHDQQVNVTFRSKESLFTSPFFIALGIALAFHLSLILVFHIAPIKIRWNQSLQLPTTVESDLNLNKESSAIANLSIDALPDNILFTAPVATPSFPATPVFSTPRQVEHSRNISLAMDLFNDVEKSIYTPQFLKASSRSSLDPFSIRLSGGLSLNELKINPLFEEKQKLISQKTKVLVAQELHFSVLVDRESGKIFWIEPLQNSNDATLNNFALSILNEMQFKTDSLAFVTSGEIALRFNPTHLEGHQ